MRDRDGADGPARAPELAIAGGPRLRRGSGGAGGPRRFVGDLRPVPGRGALPIEQLPRERAVNLIVLDGTWWQARKLLKLNSGACRPSPGRVPPAKAECLRDPPRPADFCVIDHRGTGGSAARVLEPEGGRFERLLDPFHAMVERQRWFQTEVRSSRHASPSTLTHLATNGVRRSPRRGLVTPRLRPRRGERLAASSSRATGAGDGSLGRPPSRDGRDIRGGAWHRDERSARPHPSTSICRRSASGPAAP